MPCYDSRNDGQTRTVYETGISPEDFNAVKEQARWLESALCAIFNELERRDIASEVIAESSRNGLIGLMGFWEQHYHSDKSRMAKILHSYSKDEQAIMKNILNKE